MNERTLERETVIEAMARAADTSGPSTVQGFRYGDFHVIRDLRKPPGEQEIFRKPVSECDGEDWYRECRIARRRIEMTAALTALRDMGPSEAMVEAGTIALDPDGIHLFHRDAIAVFRAMLDAALRDAAKEDTP